MNEGTPALSHMPSQGAEGNLSFYLYMEGWLCSADQCLLSSIQLTL
jgi:hypothetical protein